ncbi:MAG: hypothetical protein M3P44_08135 [Actinomycetota bacterium]|nr:hypothetical protein [Actinomycetota bacterium]
MATVDAEAPAPQRARTPPRWWPAPALVALIGLVATYVGYYAVQMHRFDNDEQFAVTGGRIFERDFVQGLTDKIIFNRGPERLTSLVMWVPNTLFSSTPDQMRGAHLLLGTAFCLAAIPAYALGRGMGLARRPSLAVAAMTLLTPWLILGTTFLNVTLALPLTAAFVWACWRTAVRPSALGDVLVLVLALLNITARAAHAPFAILVAIPVVWAAWHARPAGEPATASLRRLPGRLIRAHPVLAAVGILAVLVLLVARPATPFGAAYGVQTASPRLIDLSGMWDHLGLATAELTLGTAYLPVIIGVPWLVMQSLRPSSLETGAFAATALGLFAIFVWVTGTVGTTSEERYVAVLGLLPVVAFGAAVFRREVSFVGTLVVGVLASRAVVTNGVYPDDGIYSYILGPARQFFSNVILGRLSAVVGHDDPTFAMIIAVAAALCLVAALRSRIAVARTATAAGIAAVIVVGTAGGAYAMQKFAPGRQPWLSFERAAWVDSATGNRAALMLENDPHPNGDRQYTSLLAQFFNRTLCCGSVPDLRPYVDGARDGAIRLPFPTPGYVVHFTGYHNVGLDARRVRTSTALGAAEPMILERFNATPRAAYVIDGPAPDGSLTSGAGAIVRILPAAPRRRACLRVPLSLPAQSAGRVGYRVTSGHRRITGDLRRSGVTTVAVPIPRRGDVAIRATTAGPKERGGTVAILGEVRLQRCGA